MESDRCLREEGVSGLESPSYQRFMDGIIEEMATTVEMMREGLPKMTLQVRHVCTA